MNIDEKLENILKQLVGKKFKLVDFANSLQQSPEEILERLFELQENGQIDFMPISDGTIRISRAETVEAKGSIASSNLFEFSISVFRFNIDR